MSGSQSGRLQDTFILLLKSRRAFTFNANLILNKGSKIIGLNTERIARAVQSQLSFLWVQITVIPTLTVYISYDVINGISLVNCVP